MAEDILDITPPAGIPGALFNAIVDVLQDHYKNVVPGTGKKLAQRAALRVLNTTLKFYEAASQLEE